MSITITIYGLSKFWFLICEVLLSNSIVKSCTYILQSTTYPGLVTKAIGASKGKKRARKLLRPRLRAAATTLLHYIVVLMLDPRRIF